MSEMQTLIGQVTRLIFSGKADSFRIFEVQPKGANKREIVIGEWQQARVGANIEAAGIWEKRKGKDEIQFKARSILEIVPTSADSILSWLEGGAVKGIGKVSAKKLVACFGAGLLEILDQHPERIVEAGIGKKQREKIIEGWKIASATRIIMQFLREVGIGPERSNAVWRQFKDHPAIAGQPAVLVARLRNNPYRLIRVRGIGFSLADQAAGKLGIRADADYRVDAGIEHTLQTRTEDGHVWTPEPTLLGLCKELLGVSQEKIVARIQVMQEAQQLATEPGAPNRFASVRLSRMEISLAAKIRAMSGPAPRKTMRFPAGFVPDPTQIEALNQISDRRLAILAGGPGMGKTTLLKTCAQSAVASGMTVALCAPTGRAAKRMNEATGMEAKTIHRLLEMKKGGLAERNRDHPIEADWIIVDEVSMLDMELAWKLFDAIPAHARVLLVGDPDQLPSVGPGQVLADLIACGKVTVARLSKIFRQQAGSGIPVMATQVIQGVVPNLDPDSADCPFVDAECIGEESEEGADATAVVVQRIVQESRELGARMQALAPMRNGPLGTLKLNQALREAFNPDAGQPHRGRFRLGDWVIQTRNNYDLDVYNGDLGTVVAIEEGEETALVVDFEDRVVRYEDNEDLRDLDHAYCLTIHKSQGGQFPGVALVATTAHFVMLKRNLLYTGMTRAEKHLLLVSTKRALQIACKKSGIEKRDTLLAQRIAG
jgi:exodeoxyribonuclease V alpha subunit